MVVVEKKRGGEVATSAATVVVYYCTVHFGTLQSDGGSELEAGAEKQRERDCKSCHAKPAGGSVGGGGACHYFVQGRQVAG